MVVREFMMDPFSTPVGGNNMRPTLVGRYSGNPKTQYAPLGCGLRKVR